MYGSIGRKPKKIALNYIPPLHIESRLFTGIPCTPGYNIEYVKKQVLCHVAIGF